MKVFNGYYAPVQMLRICIVAIKPSQYYARQSVVPPPLFNYYTIHGRQTVVARPTLVRLEDEEKAQVYIDSILMIWTV